MVTAATDLTPTKIDLGKYGGEVSAAAELHNKYMNESGRLKYCLRILYSIDCGHHSRPRWYLVSAVCKTHIPVIAVAQ